MTLGVAEDFRRMKAMVLAAGVGSRLDPLTTVLPKPLVPVANSPVMEHIVRLLSVHGFTDIVANLHYLPDSIRNYFGNGSRLGVNLTFKYEEELSGDAGGVRACKDFFGNETFVVMMGDLVTDADISRIVMEHKRKKAIATIAIKQVEDVEHFGVVVQNEEGYITGFQEKPKREEAKSNRASAGIYVLEPKVFDHMPETGSYGFGRQLFPTLVEKGLPVLGCEIGSYWSDVGTIKQYRETNFDVIRGMLNIPVPGLKEMVDGQIRYLEAGASVNSGSVMHGPAMLGANSKVLSGCSLHGSIVIGNNVTVEDGAYLENVVICDGARVARGARLKDTIVGPDYVVPADSSHEEATLIADRKPQTAGFTSSV